MIHITFKVERNAGALLGENQPLECWSSWYPPHTKNKKQIILRPDQIILNSDLKVNHEPMNPTPNPKS